MARPSVAVQVIRVDERSHLICDVVAASAGRVGVNSIPGAQLASYHDDLAVRSLVPITPLTWAEQLPHLMCYGALGEFASVAFLNQNLLSLLRVSATILR